MCEAVGADHWTPRVGRRVELASHPRFGIYADEVEVPGEPDTRRYLVVSPHGSTAGGVTGVAILPVREGRVALVRMYRHAIGGDSWEIPRGFVDGEPARIAAHRELEEETGLVCADDRLEPLAVVSPDAGIFAAKVQLFAALDCRVVRPFEPRELGQRELAWFDADEVDRAIAAGRIHDSYTLVAHASLRLRTVPA